MEALLTSIGVVALAEIDDKTKLLAILLTTRFNKPVPVIAGIFVATIANHFLAALVGAQAASFLTGDVFRLTVAASFIGMAILALFPNKLENVEVKPSRYGAFLTTCVVFFLVEMGDKTQLATAALGARYQDVVVVTMSTTIGMMLVNVPAVFLGHKLLQHFSLKAVRLCSALMFFGLGVWMLFQ